MEGTETVSVTLTGIASGDPEVTIGGTISAAINVFDNDAASWTISGDANVSEGANASYDVVLSGSFQAGEDASVDLALADVDTTSSDYADFNAAVASAVAAYSGPGSYSLVGSALTWTATADGQSADPLTINLGASDDATVEASEDYTVSLSSAASSTGASVNLGASTAVTTTITDNDAATVSIAATTDADEAGLVNGVFTVTLSNPSSTDTVINYTVAGSASSGNDFTPLSGTVTIAAGDTSAVISVPVADDSLVEGTETVSVSLTGIASGDPEVTIGGTSSAAINMLDNDSASWTISGDASVSEGGNASYDVVLSGSFQAGEDASVDLALADVDTTSSDYADFNAAVASAVAAYSGPGSYSLVGSTLTWTATADGQTADPLTINLGVVDDVAVEGNEDYTISLSNPASATGASVNLGVTTAVTTTIFDNDAATVSIAATANGEETGPVNGQFTVILSTVSATDTQVDYVVGGSGTSGSDFVPLTGQVTILAGDTTATIDVTTIDDTAVEGTEDVSVTLTGLASGDPSIAIGGVTSASIDLLDNDAASWTISGDASVVEGASASYIVALSGSFQSGEEASVDLGLADIDTTSSDHADFVAAVTSAVGAYAGPGSYSWDGTTLRFTADADSQTAGVLNISLGANDDVSVEAIENYSISLSNPASLSGASVNLGASTSVTTAIIDNDAATISIMATADGFESGSAAGRFTVLISTPSSTDTVIDYTLTGTATSSNDYTPLTGQVTILAGDTFATIDIPTIDDAMAEPTETVIATLTGIASGDADISIGGTSSATIDLIDNDNVTWSLTGDATVTEGVAANYALHLAGIVPNGEAISVDLSLADVTTASSDYANFDAAVTSAVGSYAGPGSYAWDGTTLTWTASADNQAPTDLVISLAATDDSLYEGDENYDILISNASSLGGGAANIDAVQDIVNTTITDNDSRPATADQTVSTDEDVALAFAPTDFPFADADIADTLQSITIVNLPTVGTLTLGGIPVVAGQVVPVGQISTLVYDSLPHEHGVGYTTFDFTVSDGTNSSDPAVMTIDVAPVNDDPLFNTLDDTPTFAEGGSPVVLDDDATVSDLELGAIDNFAGATLTLTRNGGANADDIFGSSGTLAPLIQGGSLIVSGTTIGDVTTNNAGTLVLTFNSNATTALVNATLQRITYSNSSAAPPRP